MVIFIQIFDLSFPIYKIYTKVCPNYLVSTSRPEMFLWLEENTYTCKLVCINYDYDIRKSFSYFIFKFVDPDEALLFKLMWS